MESEAPSDEASPVGAAADHATIDPAGGGDSASSSTAGSTAEPAADASTPSAPTANGSSAGSTAAADPDGPTDASAPDGPTPPSTADGSPDDARQTRSRLAEELFNEMAAWSPRDRFGAFRKWHQGALSLVHLNVLTILEVAGPQPMHRVAEVLDVSDASATGIVERMERRGLVERRHATDDRRLVLVHPGPGAANVFREMQEHRLAGLRKMLELLGDDELAALLVGIRALHRARAKLMEDAPPMPLGGDLGEPREHPDDSTDLAPGG